MHGRHVMKGVRRPGSRAALKLAHTAAHLRWYHRRRPGTDKIADDNDDVEMMNFITDFYLAYLEAPKIKCRFYCDNLTEGCLGAHKSSTLVLWA